MTMKIMIVGLNREIQLETESIARKIFKWFLKCFKVLPQHIYKKKTIKNLPDMNIFRFKLKVSKKEIFYENFYLNKICKLY